MSIAPYAKALTGALVAGLTGIATALDDGSVSAQEYVYAAIAFLVGLGAVWAVPNDDPTAVHQDESVRPPEAGYGAIELLVVVIVVVILLVILARLV